MGKNVEPDKYENSVVFYDAISKKWLLYHNPLRIYVTYDLKSVLNVLSAVEDDVKDNGLYASGFVSYEASPAFDPALVAQSQGDFPLLWFGIYRQPEQITFPSFTEKYSDSIDWKPSVSENEYSILFNRIKDYIRSGDTYQVNYSFRLQASFFKNPWNFFVQMIHAQGYGYGAFVHTKDWAVCSSSPELFFALEGEHLISKPMKGTVQRGLGQDDDLEKAAWLIDSEKNKAENVMIVDMVRNDISRLTDVSSVGVSGLFDIEKHPTLWHLTSTVHCKTRARITDIFRALFPAASITGAPKVRTTQIIAELENSPRKIYTGTIGSISPGRNAQFNVAIRTVLVDKKNKTAEYGVGGGIVWDSENIDELQECYTKAKILVQPMPAFALLETILWTPEEGYSLLDAHLKRLVDSAEYFSRSVNIEAILEMMKKLETRLSSMPHKIRLIVPQEGEPILEFHLLTNLPQPYRIAIAKRPVDSQDHFLYHKTTYRRVYEKALAELPGYDDALLWNEREELTESCFANVVVNINGRFLTPPLHSGMLQGIYRSLLIRQGKIKEEIISLQDLDHCLGIHLINSVRGMWEVSPEKLSV